MSSLKLISPEGIPLALQKAERYRLINEPAQAESICLDVLAIDDDNQPALKMLLLALTDEFQGGPAECVTRAKAVVAKLTDEYERLYYSGLICERQGRARLVQGGPGSGKVAYQRIREAFAFYEQAERIRPGGNDDALLRWNSCVRLCERHHLAPEAEEVFQPVVGDD